MYRYQYLCDRIFAEFIFIRRHLPELNIDYVKRNSKLITHSHFSQRFHVTFVKCMPTIPSPRIFLFVDQIKWVPDNAFRLRRVFECKRCRFSYLRSEYMRSHNRRNSEKKQKSGASLNVCQLLFLWKYELDVPKPEIAWVSRDGVNCTALLRDAHSSELHLWPPLSLHLHTPPLHTSRRSETQTSLSLWEYIHLCRQLINSFPDLILVNIQLCGQ